MEELVFAWIYEKNWETVKVICPFCGCVNIYNRATDLKELSPITSGNPVQCDGCQKQFGIVGDIVNPDYEKLIFDCHELQKQKRYGHCILNLAQSFEMFFALFLRVELLYKPFSREKTSDIRRLEKAKEKLEKKIHSFTFSDMRSYFLNLIILTRILKIKTPSSLGEAEVVLSQLSTNHPSLNILSHINDSKFEDLLHKVSQTKIGELRNNVVHKSGYRPLKKEFDNALIETQEIQNGLLFFLGTLTDNYWAYRGHLIHHDICTAIREKKVITFSYMGKEYEVAPHCLFEEDGIEQIQGFDPNEDIHIHKTIKTYPVSEITSLKKTNRNFPSHLGYHFVQKYKTIVYCLINKPKKWGE